MIDAPVLVLGSGVSGIARVLGLGTVDADVPGTVVVEGLGTGSVFVPGILGSRLPVCSVAADVLADIDILLSPTVGVAVGLLDACSLLGNCPGSLLVSSVLGVEDPGAVLQTKVTR